MLQASIWRVTVEALKIVKREEKKRTREREREREREILRSYFVFLLLRVSSGIECLVTLITGLSNIQIYIQIFLSYNV